MREGDRFISTAKVVDRDGVTQFHITLTSWAKIILIILGILPLFVIVCLTGLVYINKIQIENVQQELKIERDKQHDTVR